jgi:transcriptional regulator with XRE-family HTH domain
MARKRSGVPTQRDIARRCGLDVSTVNKILRKAPGPAFNKETVRRVRRAAEELGYDLRRLKHSHRRKHERRTGSVRVGVLIYDSGAVVDRGVGMLVEISQSSARLDQVKLPKRILPLDGFGIGIMVLSQDGTDAELRGRLSRVVKLQRDHSLGIQFERSLTDGFLDGLRGFRAPAPP